MHTCTPVEPPLRHVSIEKIYECRETIDKDLFAKFQRTFEHTLQRFKSLSKSITYKKVQKANILNITKENDNIITLLNKITAQNFNRIESKINLKKTSNNCMSFVEQILRYIEKTDVKNVPLCYRMLKTLYRTSDENTKTKISERIQLFIQTFVNDLNMYTHVTKTFDADEEYASFVQRNSDNNAIINRMRAISAMIKDTNLYSLSTNITEIYTLIVDQLKTNIDLADTDNSMINNFIFLMFEFVIVILSDSNFRKNKGLLSTFLEHFNNDAVKKKLTNKNRFKMLDIFDSIEKYS